MEQGTPDRAEAPLKPKHVWGIPIRLTDDEDTMCLKEPYWTNNALHTEGSDSTSGFMTLKWAS